MKNRKKIILGLALLTSLTVFAVGTTTNNSAKTTTNTTNRQKPVNNVPKISTQKMEELKNKIKNGNKLTDEESQIILQILERKSGFKGNRSRRGQKPSKTAPNTNTGSKTSVQ